MVKRPEEPPFGRNRNYYLFLKIAVLIIVGLMALHFFGRA